MSIRIEPDWQYMVKWEDATYRVDGDEIELTPPAGAGWELVRPVTFVTSNCLPYAVSTWRRDGGWT